MKALIVMSLCALPVAALAAGDPDQSFFRKAAEGGKAEVAAGRLAEQKASSQSVKDFGAMMVKDHSAANAKLRKLAAEKHVALPKGVGAMNAATAQKLKLKSGADFDRDYIDQQIKAHQQTIDLLQKEIDTGKDAQAQEFAQSILPTVKEHLAKANELASQTGSH